MIGCRSPSPRVATDSGRRSIHPRRSTDCRPSRSSTPILAHHYPVTPFIRFNLAPQAWSAEWTGTIDLPASGTYRFEAERLSRAGLWIDDQLVFDDTQEGAGPSQSGTIQRSAGLHQIRMRLQERGEGGTRLYLYWTQPGGGRELVPGRVL